jgi:hypothetical protein
VWGILKEEVCLMNRSESGLTQCSSFLRFPIPTNLFAAPFGLVKRKSHWFAGQKAMLFAAST